MPSFIWHGRQPRRTVCADGVGDQHIWRARGVHEQELRRVRIGGEHHTVMGGLSTVDGRIETKCDGVIRAKYLRRVCARDPESRRQHGVRFDTLFGGVNVPHACVIWDVWKGERVRDVWRAHGLCYRKE